MYLIAIDPKTGYVRASGELYDLEKAMERIAAIDFLEDQVVIHLADPSINSKITILMLRVMLYTKGGVMPQQSMDEVADYDEKNNTLSIGVTGCYKLSFYMIGENEAYTWPIPDEIKTDHST
jgi:hypothetical protein